MCMLYWSRMLGQHFGQLHWGVCYARRPRRWRGRSTAYDVIFFGVPGKSEFSVSSGSLIETRIEAASSNWTCWCLEMSSLEVMLHSGVCSHKCLAREVMCLYPFPQAWHLSSSFKRPVSPSEILRATNFLERRGIFCGGPCGRQPERHFLTR